MPLFACPDCGRHISSKIEACPHCHCPVDSTSVTNTMLLSIDTIKETVKDAIRTDLISWEAHNGYNRYNTGPVFVFELNGEQQYLRFWLEGNDNRLLQGESLAGCNKRIGTYSVNWESNMLFMSSSFLSGSYWMRCGKGKIYLLTPLGTVEYILYKAN